LGLYIYLIYVGKSKKLLGFTPVDSDEISYVSGERSFMTQADSLLPNC